VKNPRLLLWLVAIGFFMETLDSTIVNTALPSMAKSLGERPLLMESVVIAYSLTLAVFIPASGWLADRFGTKNIFFSAILIFSLGSLCCASSHTLIQLSASRVLQGLGGSMLMPIGRLAVLQAFPGDAFLEAISFVAIPALIGPLIGPTLGGWLVEYASWHWIFLINLPIGLVGCIATWFAMSDTRGESRRSFDVGGFLMTALAMVAISFALDGVSELGFSSVTVIMLMLLGFVCMTAYWLSSNRKKEPLFSPELFKIPTFNLGLLGNLFARMGCSGMPFLIPLLLQIGVNYSPFQAGMAMLPVAIAGILAKRLATPLVLRFGYRNFLVVNTFLVGLSIASIALITSGQSSIVRVLLLFFFGCVNSLQYTAMNSLTLKDLGRAQASSGNSMYSMVQMLAMSFAVAISAAVLNTFMDHYHAIGNSELSLRAFHATVICMAFITVLSVWIFWQLSPRVKASAEQAPAFH
jgi:EmrB/QacA subfamily drug resistance transporter